MTGEIAATPSRLLGRGLACRRGGRLVFQGVDIDLASGDALVVTGVNGAGKSTLLRLLAGLIAPSAGTLLWDGVAVDDEPDRLRHAAAYAGHFDPVKRPLTVAENLIGWARLEDGGDIGDRVASALDLFGLDALADLPARYLSAGQRRRLALARLLVTPRPLWLLDEPTVALDGQAVAVLATIVTRHRAAGGAVVVATHAGLSWPGARRLALATIAETGLPSDPEYSSL